MGAVAEARRRTIKTRKTKGIIRIRNKERNNGGDPDGDGDPSSSSSSDDTSSSDGTSSRSERRRRRGSRSTDKVEMPKWPKAAGLEQWFERVCRIVSGAARDYDAAYRWTIRVGVKEDSIVDELKESGPRFDQID